MPLPFLYHKSQDHWGSLPIPRCVDLQAVWGSLIGKSVIEDSNVIRRIEMNRRLDNILAAKLEAGGIKCRQEADSDIVDYPLNGCPPISVQRRGELKNARWLIFFFNAVCRWPLSEKAAGSTTTATWSEIAIRPHGRSIAWMATP